MTKKDLLTGDDLCEHCDRRACTCPSIARAMQEKEVDRFEKVYFEELNKLLLMVAKDQTTYGTLLGVLLLRDHLESLRHPKS